MAHQIIDFFSNVISFFQNFISIINSFSPLGALALSLFFGFIGIFIPVRIVRRLIGE